jgi:hypothetical protein
VYRIKSALIFPMTTLTRIFFVAWAFASVARADPSPSSLIPPASTLSPDRRYGVTVPASFTDPDALSEENDIIDMKTKRVLGAINTDDTAFSRMNHSDLLPAWWSTDNTYVLWQVEGKWGMETQMLIHLQGGEIQWELDVIKVLQRQILTRTEAADPKKFLAAKKSNWGSGSAYPEKFVFDSQPDEMNKGSLTFPIHFRVYLTSNCKGSDDVPNIDSEMEATLNRDGDITVTRFRMGRSRSSPWYSLQTESN